MFTVNVKFIAVSREQDNIERLPNVCLINHAGVLPNSASLPKFTLIDFCSFFVSENFNNSFFDRERSTMSEGIFVFVSVSSIASGRISSSTMRGTQVSVRIGEEDAHFGKDTELETESQCNNKLRLLL